MEGEVEGDDPPGKGDLLKRWEVIPVAGFQQPRIQTWERQRVPLLPDSPQLGMGKLEGGPERQEGGKGAGDPISGLREMVSSFGNTQSPVLQGARPSESQPD